MKKKLFLFATILLLVGCGKKGPDVKKLTCTKTISDSKSDVVYKMVYKYEDEKLIDVNSSTVIKFKPDGIENLETFKTYAESTNNNRNNKKGVKSTLDVDDESITVETTYTIADMDKDEIKNNNFNLKYNRLKKRNEENEYTCK